MGSYFKGKWQTLEKNQINSANFLSFGQRICLYDLGSSGGTPPPFCWILEGIDLVNFEPDPKADSEGGGSTLPIAIGPKRLNKIFLNKRPTTSSLLEPYKPVVDRYDFTRIFKNEGDIFHTVETQEVETYGLDEIIQFKKLQPPDFLKIDVQGLSLEVLESGEKCLSESVIGIQIEVEFLETYKGQKTFGAVHEYLIDKGFEIFRLTNLNRWYYKTKIPTKLYTGQDTFCDLLYLRNIDSIQEGHKFWDQEKAIKAILIFLLYDLTDAAMAYLDRFESKNIIPETISKKLEHLIGNWEGAMKYFYINEDKAAVNYNIKDKAAVNYKKKNKVTGKAPHKSLYNKLMDVSPRKLIAFIKNIIVS